MLLRHNITAASAMDAVTAQAPHPKWAKRGRRRHYASDRTVKDSGRRKPLQKIVEHGVDQLLIGFDQGLAFFDRHLRTHALE